MTKETEDVAAAVGAAHRALTSALMRALDRKGFDDLSPAYAAILPMIDPAGSRQVTVAQRAGLTKQAVGQLVQELVARGYLELVADPSDRRARIVRFTPRGLVLRTAGLEVKRELRTVLALALGERAIADLASHLHMAATALAGWPSDA